FGRFFHRFFGSRFFAAGFLRRRGCLECLADRYLSINNARAVGRAGLWLPLRLSGQLAGHLPVTLVLTVGPAFGFPDLVREFADAVLIEVHGCFSVYRFRCDGVQQDRVLCRAGSPETPPAPPPRPARPDGA